MLPDPRTLLILSVLGLAACNSAVGTEVSRAAAKSVVTPIVADRFPGIPVSTATDCVIDNATGEEIVVLASAAATRNDRAAVDVVTTVAQRPGTLRCFGEQALPTILRSL